MKSTAVIIPHAFFACKTRVIPARTRRYRADNTCPFRAMSFSWLPRSMMRPWSSTMMTSEFLTVESRCAMTNTVRPSISSSMPLCTSASVRVSMELVASSRIMTGGSATAARAMRQQLPLPLATGSLPSPVSTVLIAVRAARVMKSSRIGELRRGDAFLIRRSPDCRSGYFP